MSNASTLSDHDELAPGLFDSESRNGPLEEESLLGKPRENGQGNGSGIAVLSGIQRSAIVFTLSGVGFCASMSSGLITVCLPVIAKDVQLPEHLFLW